MKNKSHKAFQKIIVLLLIMTMSFCLSGCSSIIYNLVNNMVDKEGLILMSDDEKIVNMDCIYRLRCVVTDKGNCYIDGQNLSEPLYYGLDEESRSKYNKLAYIYVGIYDGCNAESVNLAADGGCIITDQHDVYLFLNDTNDNIDHDGTFRTPTFFCSGCIDAEIGYDGQIYLLKENGDFGFVTVNKPTEFHKLSENIMKFRTTVLNKEKKMILFLLNDDNELFTINSKGESVSYNIPKMENIKDFDCLCCGNDYHAFSILKTNGEAYAYWGLIYPVDDLASVDAEFSRAANDIVSVCSYCQGTAALDQQGTVYLYGSNASSRMSAGYKLDFQGEKIFQDIESIYSSDEMLITIDQEGTLEQYGYLPNNTYRPIEAE